MADVVQGLVTERDDTERPIRLRPVRSVPDVPAYLYFGAVAGASAGLAAVADLAGERDLATAARIAAATGAGGAVAALVADHRRPQRFLVGLRPIDPAFPLDLGTWLLLPFAGLAATSAVGGLLGWGLTARATGVAAGALGPLVCAHTAVALVDTDVPAWHEAYRELPFLFTGSGVSGAAGVALLTSADPVPARRLAVAGAAMELAAALRLRTVVGRFGLPFRSGRAGRLLDVGTGLTVAGAGLALLARRRFGRVGRWSGVAAGLALLASGVLHRVAVYDAGAQSAETLARAVAD